MERFVPNRAYGGKVAAFIRSGELLVSSLEGRANVCVVLMARADGGESNKMNPT